MIVNVAFNKPAYQKYPMSPGNGTFDASNALDGRKSDLSSWGGQCAVSALARTTATWWVNLTSIRSIHHITIFFLTNNMQGKSTLIIIFTLQITEKAEVYNCKERIKMCKVRISYVFFLFPVLSIQRIILMYFLFPLDLEILTPTSSFFEFWRTRMWNNQTVSINLIKRNIRCNNNFKMTDDSPCYLMS